MNHETVDSVRVTHRTPHRCQNDESPPMFGKKSFIKHVSRFADERRRSSARRVPCRAQVGPRATLKLEDRLTTDECRPIGNMLGAGGQRKKRRRWSCTVPPTKSQVHPAAITYHSRADRSWSSTYTRCLRAAGDWRTVWAMNAFIFSGQYEVGTFETRAARPAERQPCSSNRRR